MDAAITHVEEMAEDKQIKSLWCVLDEDVDRLCGLWKLYKQLFGSTENVELLFQNGSYVFFQLQRLITDHVSLTLIKLSDPAEMGKDRRSGEERKNASLPMLLERMKGIVDDKSLAEFEAQFEEYKRVCENIKPHRNKRIGHTDIKRAEDPTFKWLPAVTLEEVDGALGVLRRMMQGLILALLDRDYDYDPDLPLGRDGNRLLYLLRKAHELQLHTPRTEGVV